jgi:hypothetical protein
LVERILVIIQLVTQPIVGVFEINCIVITIVQSFSSSACDLGEGVWIFKDASRDSGRTVLRQRGVETKERHIELAKKEKKMKMK